MERMVSTRPPSRPISLPSTPSHPFQPPHPPLLALLRVRESVVVIFHEMDAIRHEARESAERAEGGQGGREGGQEVRAVVVTYILK
jgi:hypothetical protein